MTFLTIDRADYLVAQRLGRKQSITPEGFLLVRDVPIARIGTQIYGPNETPLDTGVDGLVHVLREEKEVFRPETIASFEGKDICDDHPSDNVTPDNWRGLSVGHVQNVHRGTGVEDDFLFADMLIKDAAAIAAVREGKREVSCGYNAEYEQTGPGRGRQYDIVGNHVALVERGRCGPRCAIGDADMPKKVTIRDRLMKLYRAKDAAELEEALNQEMPTEGEDAEMGASGHHIEIHNHMPSETPDAEETPGGGGGGEALPPWFTEHVNQNNQRFDKLESMIAALASGDEGEDEGETDPMAEGEGADAAMEKEFEEEAPPGTGDKARKARDSAYFADSFQDTASMAEIIVPGVQLPTFDKAAAPKKTFTAVCDLRRRTLDLAYGKPETRALIDDVLRGKTFNTKDMSCGALRQLFYAVGAMKKRVNDAGANNSNAGMTFASAGGMGVPAKAKLRTPADLNKRNAEIYGGAR